MRFHIQDQSYQFKALPFSLSTAPMEFTVVVKEVKLMALQRGIRIHQYLDDWLVRATSHQTCLQHTQTLVALCQELGWLVNKEKSELDPKQVFNFVGYQFDLREGKVRPTPDRWQTLQDKILSILSGPVCPVRQFMSFIGLLTATEKQVHLGRLHMRPIQWHLKNDTVALEEQLEGTGITRKGDTRPQVAPPPLKESNVLSGQPLHPLKHALQIFTNASKEGWGAQLNERTARGSWSLPESKLHINHLELKAVFLALKEFQDLCSNNIVLVATDNTTVVAYVNKEGGMKSGSLCPLLWRILEHQETALKARHIPGRLNVIADKLSRFGQTIQTEWSLHPEVFQAICSRWHQPQVDLFATRFNNKLPQFVSLVPDPQAWAVGLSTSSHLGQSGGEVTGLPLQQDHLDCPRVAQHTLVLGPSGNVQSDPSVSAQPAQSGISTIQPDPAQELVKPALTCLAPRATAIKE